MSIVQALFSASAVVVPALLRDGPKSVYRFNGECIDEVVRNPFTSIYDWTGPNPDLWAIFGVGDHDLWVVGDLGLIVRIRR